MFSSRKNDRSFAVVRFALNTLVLSSVMVGGLASAFTPTLSKLSGRPHANPGFDNIGWAVGCSEKWIVSTAPADDSVAGGSNAGAVYVYGAATGRFAKKIRPADLAAGDSFGQALAVCGDLALITAQGQGDGVVYLCNLATGAVVRKFASPTVDSSFGRNLALSPDYAVIGAFQENSDAGAVYVYKLATTDAPLRIAPPAPATASKFGFQVAVQNEFIIVTALNSDLAASNAGAVFVFSSTGSLLHSITESIPDEANYFGDSLAVSGRQLLISASNHSSGRGRVYKYDLVMGNLQGVLTALDAQSGDRFGAALALSGNLAIVGASGDDDSDTDAGSAYLFDVRNNTQLRKLHGPAATVTDSFGNSVAIWGNQAVIGALYANDIGSRSGAAFLCRQAIASAPLFSLASAGDTAPDTQEAEFSTFTNAFINDDNEGLFEAKLTGPGGAGISGVWNNLRTATGLDVLTRTKQNLDDAPRPNFTGVKPTPLGAPIFCNASYGLSLAKLTGTGVTALNNQALFVNEPVNNDIVPILRSSDPLGFGQTLHSIQDVVQSQGTNVLLASITKRLGIGGVDATSDSAILVMDHSGNASEAFEEGADFSGGGKYGQFTGRAACGYETSFAFTANHIPNPGDAPLPSLFRGEFTGGEVILTSKGIQAADCPLQVVYSTFLTESHQSFRTVFKATLSGPNVTAANNTGLWHDLEGLIARTGSEIESGLVVSSIDKFWPMSDTQVVLQVTLKGAAVTATNNRALYLWDSAGPVQRLMRTGSFADPASGQAKISGFLQVGVHAQSGNYVIIASLSGTSAATNLGVWAGSTLEGDVTTRSALRLPSMVLRKGTTILAPSGQTTSIKSISLSTTTSAAGAGNIGKGQVISGDGNIALTLEFTNKAREVMFFVR